MLAEMTATELGDWYRYFGVMPFSAQLLDLEFAALSHTVVSLVAGATDISLKDFSLLQKNISGSETEDSLLMAAGEGITGGIRYGRTDS
ncbi:phage tail assembly protein T [Morganella psychrotolerans]|nr:phage tail assembly protein T [Morganella psychrotolerans]